MRYYRKKQANMLQNVTYFLKANQELIVERIPASKQVIEQYLRMAEGIYKGQFAGPQTALSTSPFKKGVARTAFEKVIMKLASAAVVAGDKTKPKKEETKFVTMRGLRKLTAAALCNEYETAMAKVKKIKNPAFYGLSKDFLAGAQAGYKEFSAIKNLPAMKKKENAEWNKGIDQAISDALDYLKLTMDPMMNIACADDVQMANTYKMVRIVNKKGQGRPSDKEVAYRKSRKRKKDESGSTKED